MQNPHCLLYPGGQLVALNTRVSPALEHFTVNSLGGIAFGVASGVAVGFAVVVLFDCAGILIFATHGAEEGQSLIM